LTRVRKIILAVATLWPLFYMLLFVGFIIVMSVYTSASGPIQLDQRPTLFIVLLVGSFLFTMLEQMALTGVYIYLVVKLVPQGDSLIAWLLAVILGGIIGQAVFFAVKIWPSTLPEPLHA
jgi:hypothetical protein